MVQRCVIRHELLVELLLLELRQLLLELLLMGGWGSRG